MQKELTARDKAGLRRMLASWRRHDRLVAELDAAAETQHIAPRREKAAVTA